MKRLNLNPDSYTSGIDVWDRNDRIKGVEFMCRFFKVITPVEQFASVHARLKEAGIAIETESSGLELIPVSIIEVALDYLIFS